jgi:NAD(P)-dependent dehydrogenase (short-subunit alcohol dehydrogenase family)
MEKLNEQAYNGFLNGKKVVILGGSSGIGLATAKAAAAQGAKLVIVSSNKDRVDKALNELNGENEGFAVDLANEEHVAGFFKQLGTFDHLVYTAGENLQLSNISDIALSDAKKFFDLRYWGAFMAVKYAAPHIKAGGSITLTGGVASLRPGKGWSLGASICAAMEGFTRAMAIELAPLRVNMVSPGVVRTNLWADMADADRDGMYSHISDTLPVKHVAEAAEIAQTYLYLMQQQYSTGQTVVVDGGYVLV